MGLGNEIIAEVARRKQLGSYFEFRGYQALRRINSPEELQAFLRSCGYQNPPLFPTAQAAVDYLQAVEDKMSGDESLWMSVAYTVGLLLPLLDVFFYFGAVLLWLARPWRKSMSSAHVAAAMDMIECAESDRV
jgi:hypothetical protein